MRRLNRSICGFMKADCFDLCWFDALTQRTIWYRMQTISFNINKNRHVTNVAAVEPSQKLTNSMKMTKQSEPKWQIQNFAAIERRRWMWEDLIKYNLLLRLDWEPGLRFSVCERASWDTLPYPMSNRNANELLCWEFWPDAVSFFDFDWAACRAKGDLSCKFQIFDCISCHLHWKSFFFLVESNRIEIQIVEINVTCTCRNYMIIISSHGDGYRSKIDSTKMQKRFGNVCQSDRTNQRVLAAFLFAMFEITDDTWRIHSVCSHGNGQMSLIRTRASQQLYGAGF